MKKMLFGFALLLLTASTLAAGFVPRIVIQSPRQATVFLHPPICESMVLPSIPNRGVIYAQVYVHNANTLYIEFNGHPITDEFGNIIYNPKYDPDLLEIIPLYIGDDEQRNAAILMARAENSNGSHTVYAAFVPIPPGRGQITTTSGCTTMY
jgi:hypothetical protein